MADRPNENISKQLIDKIRSCRTSFTGQKGVHTTPHILSSAESALLTYQSIDHDVNTKNKFLTAKADIVQLKNQYKLLLEYYKVTTNDENTINRVETKAAWRNLLFRVSTTALVALTLGGAYSIAGNSDSLYLPLQQKTITYYYEEKHHSEPPADLSKYEEPKKVVKVTGSSKGKPLVMVTPKL